MSCAGGDDLGEAVKRLQRENAQVTAQADSAAPSALPTLQSQSGSGQPEAATGAAPAPQPAATGAGHVTARRSSKAAEVVERHTKVKSTLQVGIKFGITVAARLP